MYEDIIPHGNRLLARIIKEEATTKSGLVQLTNTPNKWAEVLSIGEDAETSLGIGDKVFFSVFQSVEVDPQDTNLVLVKLEDILAYKTAEAPSEEIGIVG